MLPPAPRPPIFRQGPRGEFSAPFDKGPWANFMEAFSPLCHPAPTAPHLLLPGHKA